jgi:3,4-dihydroxy 2-butanone 4-phosphate synthase/GTP cyclohydrolase II
MTALAASIERFAAGEAVLVGGEHDSAIFVAAAAASVDAPGLERLHELGGGMVVLALADEIAGRLRLPELGAGRRPPVDAPFTAPIDAVSGIKGGWSLRDRARTMRVAADPLAGPADLSIPGHVHPVRVRDDGSGAATAALELARLGGCAPAVALCPVVDRDGVAASLIDARQDGDLKRLAVASSGELRGLLQARRINELAVGCALPTRDGAFEALGYVPDDDGDAIVALVHGDVAARERPLVHAHAACLLGDVLGSLMCDCRAELDGAIAATIAEGAGVILYVKPQLSARAFCGRDRPTDAGVAAGLLRRAGVTTLRLSQRSDELARDLQGLGFDVALVEA